MTPKWNSDRSVANASSSESDPTSVMWPIFQGRTCMPKNNTAASDTCTLGGYPVYAVNISTVAQLQLTVNFARSLNIRLVIKNTGHCYLGKSSGAGSLSAWLHNLKDIHFLQDFEGKGAAFKAAAGVTVLDMYQAAEAYGVSVQGGICPVLTISMNIISKLT
jgi:FAD/FMN-containing dehydrogenase